MKKTLVVGGASVNQTPLDWNGNTARIIGAVEKAKAKGVDILCLPEMAIPGYGCDDLFLTQWLSKGAWKELLVITPHTRGIAVCVGLCVYIGGRIYNGAAVLQDGEISGVTLKQNLASGDVYYEPRWFTPWPQGHVTQLHMDQLSVPAGDLTYIHHGVSFGIEICEDAWVATRSAERLTRRGAQLILNPSASHFVFSKYRKREAIVRSSSEQYHCAYVYANLVGNESGGLIYDGDTLIAHRGALLRRQPRMHFEPFALQHCEVDFDVPLAPALPLRARAETDHENEVEKNEEFAQAIALALFDYLRKSKAKGFVLSLSGGADSACCAVAVTEMLRRAALQIGWPRCMERLSCDYPNLKDAMAGMLACVYQSSPNSSAITLEAAQRLAQSIGATFYHWSIGEETASYTQKVEQAIGRQLCWERDDLALQNIQARCRAPGAWLLANVKEFILLTSSNRSEGDVGYATMDGDTCGSLAPLAGVDKPFILQWLRWAQHSLGYDGLRAVNQLTPTAELRPPQRQQTDEQDLMPYPLLAAIERQALLERKSPLQVYESLQAHFPPQTLKPAVIRFFQRWAANQWKRQRLAPSFHFDDFNISPHSGCRFPILSGGYEKELEALG